MAQFLSLSEFQMGLYFLSEWHRQRQLVRPFSSKGLLYSRYSANNCNADSCSNLRNECWLVIPE